MEPLVYDWAHMWNSSMLLLQSKHWKKKEESDLKALKVVVWWLGLTLDGVRFRWDVARLAWQDVYETSPITRNQQLFRDVVMCPRHSTLGNHSYSHIFLSERSVNYGLLSE